MQFLPAQFTVQSSSNNLYFKIPDGETRIRFMAPPVIGWRYLEFDEVTKEKIADEVWQWTPESDRVKPHPKAKKFLGFLIANLTEGAYQLWECDKATILEKIFNLASNPEYAEDMLNLDFILTKKGKDKNTSYDLMPTRKPDEAKFAVIFEEYSKRDKELDLDFEFIGRRQAEATDSELPAIDDIVNQFAV